MIKKTIHLSRFQRWIGQSVLSPIDNNDYRRLLSANFLWWSTRFMEVIIVGWLVLELTNSPWQVAVVGFFRSAPLLVSGFIAGPVIDRLGRRTIITLAQCTPLMIYALFGLLLWNELLALWQLTLGVMLVGFVWSLDWPARRGLIPDLIGKKRTVEAMLLEGYSQNIARIAGPALAGILLSRFEAMGSFGTMAGLAGFTLYILIGLNKVQLPQSTLPANSTSLSGIVEGLRYARHNQAILGAIFITIIMNFLIFPYITLLPVFARDILAQGPVGLGLLGSAAGIGAFIGLMIVTLIRNRFSNGLIFAVGSGFQALAVLGFAFSGNYLLSLILLFFSGIGQASFGVMQSSIILLSASDEMRSRAMGTIVLGIGTGPLGQLMIGASAENFGAPWAVRINAITAIIGVVLTAIILPGFRSRETK